MNMYYINKPTDRLIIYVWSLENIPNMVNLPCLIK